MKHVFSPVGASTYCKSNSVQQNSDKRVTSSFSTTPTRLQLQLHGCHKGGGTSGMGKINLLQSIHMTLKSPFISTQHKLMFCTINHNSCSKTSCCDINIHSTLLHFASKCKVMTKQLLESTSCFDITLHSATRQCCWHNITRSRSVFKNLLFLLGL